VVLAILWKDLLLEARTRYMVVSVLVFGLLVIVIFSFAIETSPRTVEQVAPGVLWVAVTFAGVLGLSRSFALERDGGNLHGLMLSPAGRDAIFFGKAASNFLFMVAVELVIFPVFAVLFNLSPVLPGMVPMALLATLGLAAVGTVFSVMAVNTRAREVMLPLLFFPVVLPVMLAALRATSDAIADGGVAGIGGPLPFLAVFDAIFLVAGPVAFQVVLQE
jgi:heme exporter protein B